ncbi:hypothetical protein V3H18_11380 [Methylocystis sp. 9N]|uniref:Uncharacterized protein n=1 Tax=Methylocystis borbori TaxID=3118750 RepID=A0ABU7XJ28_9HYPH
MTDYVYTGREPMAARAEPVAIVPDEAAVSARSTNMDWAAIIAGAVVAGAISFVLGAFGSAIGLSLASPYEGASPATHFIVLTLWALWVTVSSFAAGGYIAGRMRRRSGEVSQEEVEMRDGVHGLVLWAASMVVLALIAGASIFQVAKGGAAVAAMESARPGSTPASLVATPLDERVDFLLRGDGDLNMRDAEGRAIALSDYPRQVVRRIIARGVATGEISGADRNYLVNVLASGAGLSPTDAESRVTLTAERLREDHAQAKEAADKARKTGILLAFLSATAMLAGAAAAWAGAELGGRHRDENVGFAYLTRF